MNRRRFLEGVGLTGLTALGLGVFEEPDQPLPRAAGAAPPAGGRLPRPAESGIDHVVVVMMENRSYDHLLGWLPGGDGRQAGLRFEDRQGVAHSTWHLPDFQGCGHADPDHSPAGGLVAYDDGRCDGWLRAGANDLFAIGYYEAADLDFWRQAGADWTVLDRYFAATMAGTYANRLYQHAGCTDRMSNSAEISRLPTIWDRLRKASLRGRYYFSDAPFTALWGGRYDGISFPFETFLADCATGNLPEVAFVDPRFAGQAAGLSGDDHPHADIRIGEAFLAHVHNAVVTGPAWERTLLVINYDEWGGFFDHVPPQRAPDLDPAMALRGFRVPAVVISPRAAKGAVAHGEYDHTSILRAIEWRWNLRPLAPRDAAARNIAEVLDFAAPPRRAPRRYTVREAPGTTLCPEGDGDESAPPGVGGGG